LIEHSTKRLKRDYAVPPTAPDPRDRLIFAALRLFWEKGYASTSVSDVLQAAHMHSGSLYHFFPGKQELLLAVLETYRKGIGAMLLAPAWEGIDDPIEKVFALLARYRENIVQTECFYGCPIGSLALELHEPDPVVRDLLAANFEAWVDAVEQCLADAGPRLPANIDRRALAEFVLTTMEGGVMLSRTFRTVDYFDRAVRELRTHIERLLAEAKSAVKSASAASRKSRAKSTSARSTTTGRT
jgi:TetR/AcrR family transcriptional regulator, transcriptional repressor for nem operon